MRERAPRYFIVLLLVAYVSGCGILGQSLGDFAAPIFCTAPRDGWGWFGGAQELLLIFTIPLLVTAIFWSPARHPALVVGFIAMLALIVQWELLRRGILHCDTP